MYTIEVNTHKVSPVTSAVEVTLMKDVPSNDDSGREKTVTVFVADGELAQFIENENRRIFSQKKVSTDVKNDEFDAVCYVLELAHGKGYKSGTNDTQSGANYTQDSNGNPIPA